MTLEWLVSTEFKQITIVVTRHCNFSRETGKREICRREISHGKIRREKREIVKSKIRVLYYMFHTNPTHSAPL